MDNEGASTAWVSFSASENHWLDFHQEEMHPQFKQLSESDRAKYSTGWVQRNPHHLLYQQAEALIQTWFERQGFDAKWWWYQIEYAFRRTAHIYGCN